MTKSALNPQGEQMADESMIRTLAAQIEAIWPQEKTLIDFYRLPRNARVLDVGAGTGEFSARIAAAVARGAGARASSCCPLRSSMRAIAMPRSRRA